MHLHALDYVLWVATPSLQVCVIYFLRKRGLASQFPYFYLYNILQLASDVFLLCMQQLSYKIYFFSYWVTTAAMVVLTFALIDELFRLALHNYDALQTVGARIFRWILLLVFLGACSLAFSIPSLRNSLNLGESILAADRCARIMLCLWALLLIIGAPLMRISPKGMLFGIAIGVVVFAFAKIVVDSVFLSHTGSADVASRFNSVMYLASCALWLVYAVYGEGLPVYQPFAVVPNAEPSELPEPEDERSLMEVINETVERNLANPS